MDVLPARLLKEPVACVVHPVILTVSGNFQIEVWMLRFINEKVGKRLISRAVIANNDLYVIPARDVVECA